MPTMLAPTMNAPGATPAADEGGKTALDGDSGVSEPISLLKNGSGGSAGDDG